MSLESKDATLIVDEVTDALISATYDGLYLGFAQVREAEDGVLVADVYSDDGQRDATYELDITVGRRRETRG